MLQLVGLSTFYWKSLAQFILRWHLESFIFIEGIILKFLFKSYKRVTITARYFPSEFSHTRNRRKQLDLWTICFTGGCVRERHRDDISTSLGRFSNAHQTPGLLHNKSNKATENFFYFSKYGLPSFLKCMPKKFT